MLKDLCSPTYKKISSTLSTLLTAPEGRYIPAQGEALGKERFFVQALKGRDIMPCHVDVTPLLRQAQHKFRAVFPGHP